MNEMQLMFPLEFLVYLGQIEMHVSGKEQRRYLRLCKGRKAHMRLLGTSEDFMGKGCLG